MCTEIPLAIIAASGDRFEAIASYHVSESPTGLLKSGILVKDIQTRTLWSRADSTATDHGLFGDGD